MLAIRITGAAGLWINSTAEMILEIWASLWYHILTDLEYESRIKWGTNYYDIFLSPNEKYVSKYVNIILWFDAASLNKTIFWLKKDGFIIMNSKYTKKLSLEAQEYIENMNIHLLDLEIHDKYDNIYLLAILAKLLNIHQNILNKKVKKMFQKKPQDIIDKNIEIIENIFQTYEITSPCPYTLQCIWEPKTTLYGNKAIADGAIAGGLEYYSAYPMTPASTILTEIIKSEKVSYLQAEDEIWVINSALWASFTGARAMVWSSGGGFALMTEALSFAVQAEFPIVVALSQRAGPSTWTPTYYEQGDLNIALNPTFGDFNHVVLCPSSIEQGYYMWWQALNIADKYQCIVILLLDKQFSEAFASLDTPLQVPQIDRGIILEHPPEDYKRYQLTDSGVSPRVKVGTPNGDFIATSYEHDEFWATSEDPKIKVAMTHKRFQKLENFFEKEGIKGYEIYNKDAHKILITTSFTSYTAKEFIKQHPNFWLLIITVIKPLDARIFDEIKGKKEVIFIESNYSGQLENYITKEFGLKYHQGLNISRIRKYDLMPFYIEDFEELI